MDQRRDGPMELMKATASIVSAFLMRKDVTRADLPSFIKEIHMSLSKLIENSFENQKDKIDTSSAPYLNVSDNFIISLLNGKPYKCLRPHLKHNGLTPGEYRRKFHLPADYPMVAPNLSETRRQYAARNSGGWRGCATEGESRSG